MDVVAVRAVSTCAGVIVVVVVVVVMVEEAGIAADSAVLQKLLTIGTASVILIR